MKALPPMEVRLKGPRATSSEAMRAVDSFAETAALPPELRNDLLVVVDEIVSNALKYGGVERAALELDIRVSISGGVLELRIADNGLPFDPLAAAAPALDQPLAIRPAGGLGIHLVRALTDSQRYVRAGGRNVLVLTRALAQ